MVTPQQFPQKRVMTPVFLSYATPSNDAQAEFLNLVVARLQDEYDLLPYTIGANIDEDRQPLEQIGGYMSEVNGAITLAFRRGQIASGETRVLNDDGTKAKLATDGRYFSSPFCQIETAMAYLNGLPILVAREAGVVPDGMLQTDLHDIHSTEFDLDGTSDAADSYSSAGLSDLVEVWAAQVRLVRASRGHIKRRYDIDQLDIETDSTAKRQ